MRLNAIFLMIILCGSFILPAKASSGPELTVRDIGVLGLASHDLFTWDRKKELNQENGRFDLSTIFDYEQGKKWATGGNKKNSENAPVFTITQELVQYFKDQVVELYGNDFVLDLEKPLDYTRFPHLKEARLRTIEFFIQQVQESYKKLTQEDFPTPSIEGGDVSHASQAAFRAIHDILPGYIYRIHEGSETQFDVTDRKTVKTYLTSEELDQSIGTFDGSYDPNYLNITVAEITIIPGLAKKAIRISLRDADQKFIENFSNYRLDQMLQELQQYGEGMSRFSDISFANDFRDAFAKGTSSENNFWRIEIQN